ncbi:unnamed protein product [Clonostachys solani]|uniref:N-acetyltransferase domain-containing protein n=1 Tax=Clonostachys solani TaxID=160281 RepID=A0A9N9ZCH2_9HYPO|nr:unnamed protein product [Clonostachys solani]
MTSQAYRLRPGRKSEASGICTDLFLDTIGRDALIDILFPTRHKFPVENATDIRRLFYRRTWEPNFIFTVCVDSADKPVGFSFWKRPLSSLTFYERWISPYAWFGSLVRGLLSLRDWLLPLRNLDKKAAGTFVRVYEQVTPQYLNTDRRKNAYYLSTLVVEPKLQGSGLGTVLLKDGLRKVEEEDPNAPSWLVGVKGVEGFYGRQGFVEVGRMNVGELSHWGGGAIMIKE